MLPEVALAFNRKENDMKRILIGMAIMFSVLFSMGAMIKGRNYMYHVRDEDGVSSVCTTPGEMELYTIAFTTAAKTADYYLILVDLDDSDNRFSHAGVDGTHVEIISIGTTINANNAFVGDVSYGYLSNVSDANAVLHTFEHIPFNAYLNIFSRLYSDFTYHPIDCRTAETMGFQTTVHGLRSGINLPTTSVASLETGNGDVVLYIDVDAGNIIMSGTIQYRIVVN